MEDYPMVIFLHSPLIIWTYALNMALFRKKDPKLDI